MSAIMKMRLPRAKRQRVIDPPLTVVEAEPKPARYRAQQLPDSGRWSIYDAEEVGEVCQCPTSRVVGLLAALNGQAARERVCAL